MNAFVLCLPIIFLRYVFMRYISQVAVKRADFFPPTEGSERVALVIYQVTVLILFIYLAISRIKIDTVIAYFGIFIYLVGVILYAKATIDFCQPQASGINQRGLYRVSRNPMYVAFFLFFFGCSLLIKS